MAIGADAKNNPMAGIVGDKLANLTGLRERESLAGLERERHFAHQSEFLLVQCLLVQREGQHAGHELAYLAAHASRLLMFLLSRDRVNGRDGQDVRLDRL